MVIIGLEVKIAALRIYDNAAAHFGKWHSHGSSFWFDRLSEEVEELNGILCGDHAGSIEHELTQIAGICVNWLAKMEYQKEE